MQNAEDYTRVANTSGTTASNILNGDTYTYSDYIKDCSAERGRDISVDTDLNLVYGWHPKASPIFPSEEKRASYINNYIVNISHGGSIGSMVADGSITRGILLEAVCNAIASFYPLPTLFAANPDVFSFFTKLIIKIANYYIDLVNKGKLGVKKGEDPYEGKKWKPIEAIDMTVAKYLFFSFFNVVNIVPTREDIKEGIPFAIAKKAENDPEGIFRSLQATLMTFMSSLLPPNTSMKNLSDSIKYDFRTRIHSSNPTDEAKNEYFAEAIPLNNGVYIKSVFDKTGELIPYREAYEKFNLLFTFKFPSNYLGPNPEMPVMDDGTTPLMFLENVYGHTVERMDQIYAVELSVLRFNDPSYTKCVYFVDDNVGNTGKSTMVAFIRNSIGPAHNHTCGLKFMNNNSFALGGLIHGDKCLITYDDNDPGDYIEDVGNFKCLCTHDPVIANKKYGDMANMIFKGRMIQCMNGFPRPSDTGEAFYRRIYPMVYDTKIDKGDGNGDIPCNPRIKSEYICRQDWIDWFVTTAINANIRELPETEESKDLRKALEKEGNDVLRFIETKVNGMNQNCFQNDDMFPAYLEFCGEENRSSQTSKSTFETKMRQALNRADSQWTANYKEDNSDDIKVTNSKKHHIPYLSQNSAAIDDGIYSDLNIAKEDNLLRDKIKIKAEKAVENMYFSETRGSVRNLYYRKPEYEYAPLMRVARAFTSTEGVGCFTDDDVIQMINDDKVYENKSETTLRNEAIFDGKASCVDEIVANYKPGLVDGNSNNNEYKKTLRLFLLNKFKQLGKS